LNLLRSTTLGRKASPNTASVRAMMPRAIAKGRSAKPYELICWASQPRAASSRPGFRHFLAADLDHACAAPDRKRQRGSLESGNVKPPSGFAILAAGTDESQLTVMVANQAVASAVDIRTNNGGFPGRGGGAHNLRQHGLLYAPSEHATAHYPRVDFPGVFAVAAHYRADHSV